MRKKTSLEEVINKKEWVEKKLAGVIPLGKYLSRLIIEVTLTYWAVKFSGFGNEPAFYSAGVYGLMRNGFDGFDAIIFKKGRLCDYANQMFYDGR